MTEHKTQFSQKIKTIIDYFKGLLMTHHLDIFMSGIKRVNVAHIKNIYIKILLRVITKTSKDSQIHTAGILKEKKIRVSLN